MVKYRINLVSEMIFNSKAEAEKVMDNLVDNNIVADLVEGTLQAHPYKPNEKTFFEDSTKIEKWKDYKERKSK